MLAHVISIPPDLTPEVKRVSEPADETRDTTPRFIDLRSRLFTAERAAAVRAQALGFSLDEIREFLSLHRSGPSPCDRLVAAARRRLSAIDRDLLELNQFRGYLAEQIAVWTSCGPAGASGGSADESANRTISSLRLYWKYLSPRTG